MSSDDYGRTPPARVNITQLLKRNPKHANCDLTIHRSPKNSIYVGLYCCQHDHWFSWINAHQTHYLEQLGVPNPDQCWSYPDIQTADQYWSDQTRKNQVWDNSPWK